MSNANKAVVRKFLDSLAAGDLEGLKSTLTEDVQAICTGSSLMSGTRGYAEICGAAGMFGQITKSGLKFKILHLTAEEDRVAAEVEGTAMLVNDVAYNNQYHFLFFIRDGKIFRIKEYLDTLLLEKALVPFMPKAA